jgi:tetratricopeptide (TPR) repeat protein
MQAFIRLLVLFVCFLSVLGGSIANSQIKPENETNFGEKQITELETRLPDLINTGEKALYVNVFQADTIRRLLQSNLYKLNGTAKFNALVYIALVQETNGDFNGFFKTVAQIEKFKDDDLNSIQGFHKYQLLAYYNTIFLKHSKADKDLFLALEFAKKMKSFSAISRIYRLKSHHFMLKNEKDSAIIFTDKAIQAARRSSGKRELAESFNYQAKVYDYFGQIELAVSKNLVAYQMAIAATDLSKMSQYAREIGQKQFLIKNIDQAEVYFEEALRYAKKVKDFRQEGLALTNKAEIERARGNPAEALLMNDKALSILNSFNDQNGRGETHNHMGMAYKDLMAYPLAVNQFNLALGEFEKSMNKDKIAEVFLNVATIYKKQGLYDRALFYLKKSINVQDSYGSRNLVNNSYREMSEVYKKMGQKDKSLQFLEEYVRVQDKNSVLLASKKVAELSESYRSEQRNKLISIQADSLASQQRETELAEAKLENISLRNELQTYTIVGFLILIILAAIIGFNRNQRRQLEYKSRETEMSQTLLRTQMNPHFIFNAMSVIQSYIYDNDVKNSSKFLVNFSRLMRLILENSPKEFISISTEMDILTKYLETQKLRFEERFEFEITCDENLLFENAMIPPMITQPFIENAIEHGQLDAVQNGSIKVNFTKEDRMLKVTIQDNGIGRKSAEQKSKSKDHKSMALEITQKRIENINFKYKSNGSLNIEDQNKQDGTGTIVNIAIPYKSVDLELLGKE